MLERDEASQRLALVAGGRSETRCRNGKNCKPRKRRKNAARTHLSTAPSNDARRSFSTKETGQRQQKYTPNQQVHRPYKAMEICVDHNPVVHLVSGPDDPSIGGAIGDPVYAKRLFPLSDRVCPRQMMRAQRRRFRTGSRRLFRVNSPADFASQLFYICFLENAVFGGS